MTLRQRLALHYGALGLVAVSLITGLTYHEVATERHLTRLLQRADESEVQQRQLFDLLVFSSIPVVLVVGWWFAQRSLRPISKLAKAVEGIQAARLREPLPRSGNGDELDRLTEAFNTMAARLDHSFQQMREFTLDASHELKTPLTVMRSELETALRDAPALAPAWHEWMYRQLDEIDRLSKIVDGLTLLTNAEMGQVTLERKPIALEDLVEEGFEDALILGEPLGLHVTLKECMAARILGDRHRLRQLLLNLTDNAVKYNRAHGEVSLALRTVNEWAEIEIVNTGYGLPPELLTRVFDRFVRGEKSHTTAPGGCGLGLSIAQWIARAHEGTIRLHSVPGMTTTVIVRIPLAPTPQTADKVTELACR